ncbi:hypothetical protein M0657_012024 [Pyricularia oryzae]|nr:hypothetical protein M0657_012024 [Pyricularia oryzae]
MAKPQGSAATNECASIHRPAENIRLRQSAQLRSAHESDPDSEQDSRSQGQEQVRKNTSRHRPSEERVEQLQTSNLETALKPRFEICCPHCKYVIVTGKKQEGAYAPASDGEYSSCVDNDDEGARLEPPDLDV